jgi:hypothetical protein
VQWVLRYCRYLEWGKPPQRVELAEALAVRTVVDAI